jgi:hypothetical protein
VNVIYNRTPALQVLVLRGAPRLQPGTFPPVPHGLPFSLRQSLQSQIGLDLAPREDLLTQLHATRETLSSDFRRLVEWLHTHGIGQIGLAVKTIPLPDSVREAFTQVLRRRLAWLAKRLGTIPSTVPLDAVPLDAEGHLDLTATMRILSVNAQLLDSPKYNETVSMANCLLDLYVRYDRGDLPPDGKTRERAHHAVD